MIAVMDNVQEIFLGRGDGVFVLDIGNLIFALFDDGINLGGFILGERWVLQNLQLDED